MLSLQKDRNLLDGGNIFYCSFLLRESSYNKTEKNRRPLQFQDSSTTIGPVLEAGEEIWPW